MGSCPDTDIDPNLFPTSVLCLVFSFSIVVDAKNLLNRLFKINLSCR